MRRLLLPCLVFVLIAAAGVGATSAAPAWSAPPPGADVVTRVVLEDGTGDVWVIGDGDDEYVPAGDKPTVDVTRAVASHRAHSVVVRMHVANLKKAGSQAFMAVYRTRDAYGLVSVTTGPGTRSGRHLLVDGRFARIPCDGLTHDVDYEADLVSVRVPRSCLDRPAWVRLGLSNLLFANADGTFQEFVDNPHNARSQGGTTPRLWRA